MEEIRTPEFGNPPLAFEEWIDFDLLTAAHEVAQAMAKFDAYVANQQGACDTRTMKSMMEAARVLYEEATDY